MSDGIDFQPLSQGSSDGIDFQPMIQSQPGLATQAWNALAIPEQMSRQGLQQLSSYVPQPEPTGNLPMDILKGTPRIATETMAQAAPGFISRGALATAGAAKGLQMVAPIAGAIGSGVANQLESLTGAMPGSLRSAWNDATTMFSRGKQAAKPLYKAAQAEMNPAESIFSGMYKPGQIVDTAQEYLTKGGQLEPAEALTYRKALDILIKSGQSVKDPLYAMREGADVAAKASPTIAKADPLYQKGLYGESLRNLMPQNKYGGTSAFKTGIMAALSQAGPIGKAALPVMSPAAAGTAATAGGLMTRYAGAPLTNPALATAIEQYLSQLQGGNQSPQ